MHQAKYTKDIVRKQGLRREDAVCSDGVTVR
jgi:hypothetical protein